MREEKLNKIAGKKIQTNEKGKEKMKINEIKKIEDNKLKNKEKKVGEIDSLISHVLYNNYDEYVFKSFGVQSWGGEMVSRTGLINQRRFSRFASSRPMAKISTQALISDSILCLVKSKLSPPAHRPILRIKMS